MVATLESRPVPLDLQCVIPQALADAIPQVVKVVGLASQIASPTGVTPVTNNTGQQALNLAKSLEVSVAELQANVIQRRVVATKSAAPAGNAVIPYSFSPAMPSASYLFHVNFMAAAGHVTIPKWRVLEGSQTTTSFSLIFDDLPAAILITVVVEELKNIPAA